MTRHTTVKHGTKSEKAEDIQKLENITIKTLLVDTQKALSEDECFPNHLREKIRSYTSNPSEDLVHILNQIYNRLMKTKDGEEFYSSFYSIIVLNASMYLPELERPASTLLAQKLAVKPFHHFKQPQNIPDVHVPPVTEKEMGALQYLAGYVLKKMLKKTLQRKNHDTAKNQAIVRILHHATVDDWEDQKLVNCLNRGGLTAVSIEFQRMFLKAEIRFRIATTTNNHLKNIDVNNITHSLMQDTEVVSYYNSVVDTSGVENLQDEEKDNLLQNMLQLYLRVRAFSLARDIVGKHKLASKQKLAKCLRKDIRKSTNKPNITD